MKKRRMIQYACLVLAYLLAWGICLAVISRLSLNGRTRYLQQQSTISSLAITDVLEEMAAEDARKFIAEGGGMPGSFEAACQSLERVTAASPNADYCLMDKQGMLYQAGTATGKVLGDHIFSDVADGGYVAKYIENWNERTDNFAIVTSHTWNRDYRLVRIEPLETLSTAIAVGITVPYHGAALFNEWGVLVWRNRDVTPEIADSLSAGGTVYAQDRGNPVLSAGEKGVSNGFIPLVQPQGWFIGVQTSVRGIFPEFGPLKIVLVILFAVGLFLLLFVLIAHSRRRGRNFTSSGGNADPLTGLMPVSELEEEMKKFFRKETLNHYSLIAVDINSFRRFNTMYGNEKGDILLRAVGRRLSEHYHCSVRINGDVFAFVAPSSIGMIRDVEQDLNNAIKKELGVYYLQLISYKFGVYPLLSDTLNYREAYDGMLLALREAKNTTKQNKVVYDRKMQRISKMNKDIEMNMEKGLSHKEFMLYVQPKFDAQTLQCCGGEVLVRWQSEQMGFLTPFNFVPLFEQNGFIAELDFYMLRQMLDYIQALISQGKKPLPLSVNMSRITISFPSYLDRLVELVKQYNVPLNTIEIEITESAVTENFESVASLIGMLRELGFTVAMDDFGTGYSSLNTLRELPVDILKIDKEFLRESDTSEKGRKIIQSVINMARDLSIGTVCEGVETGLQLDFLQNAGCNLLQGYLLSKPLPYQEYVNRYV